MFIGKQDFLNKIYKEEISKPYIDSLLHIKNEFMNKRITEILRVTVPLTEKKISSGKESLISTTYST